MKNLKLNYQELAFIMNIKATDSKEIFCNILAQEKVSTKDFIEVDALCKKFKPIKSVDSRYDGINELVFNLEHKSELYRKFLRKPTYYKANRFTGQHAVFYKICSEKQLSHASSILNEQHINYIDGVNKRSTDGAQRKYVKPYV